MNRAIITIDEQGKLNFPTNGNVWMTEYEIADLFQVFISAIIANRKAILKSSVFWKEDVCREIKTQNGSIEQYNFEMIMVLAFRIKSRNAKVFREWIMKKVIQKTIQNKIFVSVQWNSKAFLN